MEAPPAISGTSIPEAADPPAISAVATGAFSTWRQPCHSCILLHGQSNRLRRDQHHHFDDKRLHKILDTDTMREYHSYSPNIARLSFQFQTQTAHSANTVWEVVTASPLEL